MKDAGSTPRKAGTKAIIDEEGSIWGTIGGGLLESEARKMAMEAIASGKAKVFDFKFAGTSAAEDKPVCGGNMRILIDSTVEECEEEYLKIADALKGRRRGVMMRVLREGRLVDVKYFSADWTGDVYDPLIDAVQRASGNAAQYVKEEEFGFEKLLEPIIPAPLLLIGGGGH